MDIRGWLGDHLSNLQYLVLGFAFDYAWGHIKLVLVPVDEYEPAILELARLNISYDLSQYWQSGKLDEICGSIRDAKIIDAPFNDPSTFSKQLGYFAPSLWRELGVGLVDLVGFSKETPAAQLSLLRHLDSMLDEANRASVDQSYAQSWSTSSWAKASTGDGYYFFPVKPNPTANARVFRTLLLVSWLARIRGIQIRSCFTVDQCYSFFRQDSADALFSEAYRPSKTALNLIGPASNSLARVMARMVPNQILITEQAVHYLGNSGERLCDMLLTQEEAARVRLDDNYYKHLVDRIEHGIGREVSQDQRLLAIEDVVEVMFNLNCSNKLIDNVTRFGFSPDERLLLFGKYDSEAIEVYNICGKAAFNGSTIQVGVFEDHTRLFSDTRFY